MILDNFPILRTNRLDLVEITQNHKPDILCLFGDKNVTRFYNLVPFENEQEAEKLIEGFKGRFIEKLGVRWGISLKGRDSIIGTIGFNNFAKQHRANIGYDLQTHFWNNEYISEALSEVVEFRFTKLDINRIEAEVMEGNIISERVLEKLEFKKEGLLREWMFWNENHYDMTMYSLLKSDVIKKTTFR